MSGGFKILRAGNVWNSRERNEKNNHQAFHTPILSCDDDGIDFALRVWFIGESKREGAHGRLTLGLFHPDFVGMLRLP